MNIEEVKAFCKDRETKKQKMIDLLKTSRATVIAEKEKREKEM
jgi:hypothetical protein